MLARGGAMDTLRPGLSPGAGICFQQFAGIVWKNHVFAPGCGDLGASSARKPKQTGVKDTLRLVLPTGVGVFLFSSLLGSFRKIMFFAPRCGDFGPRVRGSQSKPDTNPIKANRSHFSEGWEIA